MPKQERAWVTVEAILEATAQLLVAEGMGKLSTNRIAKRAGVSIGTLYQYFPDKSSIVVALGEQTLERQFAAFEEELLALVASEPDMEASVRALVIGLMDQKRMEPELSRVLLTSGAVGTEDWTQEWLMKQRRLIRSALHIHRANIRPADLDVMAYVITTAFEFILQNAIVHEPLLVRDGRLADELAELAVRYLRCDE
jgi:AcrR family transcriptional regulator